MGRRLHRNSQKRIYIEGATYFLTTITHRRYPFFAEPILCELFIYDLRYASSLKNFRIHGYALLPDHLHLLITPCGTANISMIMHNIKRNVSHNANIVMGYIPDDFSTASASDPAGEAGKAGEDNYLHLPFHLRQRRDNNKNPQRHIITVCRIGNS